MVAAIFVLIEHVADLRMSRGLAGQIAQQILFRDVSNILRFGVFGKQMTKRLIFTRARLPGN